MSAVATQPASKPFGFRDKIGYALGDMGNDFSFILASAFLMIFYTNVLGVQAAEVGTLLLVVRLADAFVDITIGRLVDRSKLRSAGRFRPWIARFGIPVAAASALMYFFGAAGWNQGAKVVYILVTYALWSVLYSAINIPYGSMAAVVTADPVQRSSLSVFRTFGAFLAQLVIVFTVPLLIFTKDANGKTQVVGHAFFWVGLAAAVVSVVAYYGCYTMSTERVRIQPKPADKAIGLGKTLGNVFKNRSMQAIIAAALLLLIAMMMVSNMTSYLWAIYFNNGEMQSTAATLALLPTLLLLPVATPMARRFGKREVSIVAVGGAGIVYILLYLLDLQQQPWGFVVATIVAGLGLGLFNMLIWAFITDVIDDHEVRSGERADGVVYSVYSWARKVGQALAFGLGGWSLGWIGYRAGTTSQSVSTVKGIYMLMTLVPGVLFALVAVVLLVWYPLTKKVVLENAATLNQRHQDAAIAAASAAAQAPATAVSSH